MGLSNIFHASRRNFREVMARRPFDPNNNSFFRRGGFLDLDSCYGTFRGLAIGCMSIFGGRHLDSWFVWLSGVLGLEAYVPPSHKVLWHGQISLVMGSVIILVDMFQLYSLFKSRHRRREMDAQIEAEIAERLAEERQARREAGLPVEEPGPPTVEDRFRDTLRRWPILHDLVWGWPLLLALPLVALADHVSALTGIFLGAIAYVINHNGLAKRRGHLGRRLVLATLVGTAAVAVWFAYAPAITGGPVPDARIGQPIAPAAPKA